MKFAESLQPMLPPGCRAEISGGTVLDVTCANPASGVAAARVVAPRCAELVAVVINRATISGDSTSPPFAYEMNLTVGTPPPPSMCRFYDETARQYVAP